MEREEFLEKAGGVFTSNEDYEDWNSRDKYNNFWSFFLDSENGWVTSVYADIPIAELYGRGHSIEHIVPKSVLKTRLAAAGKPQKVINGSTTNPLNFMAAYNNLNSLRNTREFDTEGDSIVRTERVPLNPIAARQTGLDFEGEWVVPSRTQGDVARCVLYMMLVYELDGLYEEDIDNMRRWALVDPPREWEIAFNSFVFAKHGIRNPLITEDLEELKTMLENSSLFETTLAPVPPLPSQPQPISNLPQGLKHGYAVLVGQIERFYRDPDDTPHLLFRVQDNGNSWRGAINVQSSFDVTVDPTPGVPANNLLIYVNEDWQHPITQRIVDNDYQPGINYVPRGINTGALDYIRGNLFDPKEMKIMPAEMAGENNDLFERLEANLLQARNSKATVYAFGEPFSNGRGIHNIHMNQGSIIDRFKSTDGVWQDGGLLIQFESRWVAIFTAFQSQCWHTDDTTGQANEQGRCSRFSDGSDGQGGVNSGGLVRIVSALVNPEGQDAGNEQVTLINLGDETVDLTNWQIVDRLDRSETLSGTIEPNGTKVITLSGEGAILGNTGSTITLLDAEQLRVHGISYTSSQARVQGSRITFI